MQNASSSFSVPASPERNTGMAKPEKRRAFSTTACIRALRQGREAKVVRAMAGLRAVSLRAFSEYSAICCPSVMESTAPESPSGVLTGVSESISVALPIRCRSA